MQLPTLPTEHAVPEVSREEVQRRLNDPDLVLVNVLPRAGFAHQRIPRSVSLPVEEIPARAREVLPDREREIAVYCGGFS
jgi:rhodanese-related sulfurtransferase